MKIKYSHSTKKKIERKIDVGNHGFCDEFKFANLFNVKNVPFSDEKSLFIPYFVVESTIIIFKFEVNVTLSCVP